MSDSFDMTEIYKQQRLIEQQQMDMACRQIEFDGIMAQFQAQMMISNFNMLSLFYASLNPNLSDDDLKKIFGKRLCQT